MQLTHSPSATSAQDLHSLNMYAERAKGETSLYRTENTLYSTRDQTAVRSDNTYETCKQCVIRVRRIWVLEQY